MMREPCPIPRCALEVHLGAALIVIALFLAVGSADSRWFIDNLQLPYLRILTTRILWIIVFFLSGTLQLGVLFSEHRILHRWSAGCGWFAMLVFTISQLNGWQTPILAGVTALFCVSEFYVFTMMRGAQWSHGTRT